MSRPPNQETYGFADEPPPPPRRTDFDRSEVDRDNPFRRRRRREKEEPSPQFRQAQVEAAIALYGVAALQLVCGFAMLALVTIMFRGGLQTKILMVVVVVTYSVAVIFAGLGTWALWQPLPAAIVGLVLYVGILVLDLIVSQGQIGWGLYIRFALVAGLVRAINTATRDR
jgi:hypothetical protein